MKQTKICPLQIKRIHLPFRFRLNLFYTNSPSPLSYGLHIKNLYSNIPFQIDMPLLKVPLCTHPFYGYIPAVRITQLHFHFLPVYNTILSFRLHHIVYNNILHFQPQCDVCLYSSCFACPLHRL